MKLPLFILEDSRGCTFSCPFCSHPTISGGKSRQHSVEWVGREVLRLRDQFGAKAFRLSGSCPAPGFLNSFSSWLIEHDAGANLSSFLHSRYQSQVNLSSMAQAGFRSFLTGTESADMKGNASFFSKSIHIEDARLLRAMTAKSAGRKLFGRTRRSGN